MSGHVFHPFSRRDTGILLGTGCASKSSCLRAFASSCEANPVSIIDSPLKDPSRPSQDIHGGFRHPPMNPPHPTKGQEGGIFLRGRSGEPGVDQRGRGCWLNGFPKWRSRYPRGCDRCAAGTGFRHIRRGTDEAPVLRLLYPNPFYFPDESGPNPGVLGVHGDTIVL